MAYRADPEQKERSAYIRLFWQEGKAEDVLLADDARRLRRMLTGGESATGVPERGGRGVRRRCCRRRAR